MSCALCELNILIHKNILYVASTTKNLSNGQKINEYKIVDENQAHRTTQDKISLHIKVNVVKSTLNYGSAPITVPDKTDAAECDKVP